LSQRGEKTPTAFARRPGHHRHGDASKIAPEGGADGAHGSAALSPIGLKPSRSNPLSRAIRAIGKGDRAAFSRLLGVLAPKTKSYLLLRGAPEAEAEAAALGAMVLIWRHSAKFNPTNETAAGFIFRMVRDEAAACRRLRRDMRS